MHGLNRLERKAGSARTRFERFGYGQEPPKRREPPRSLRRKTQFSRGREEGGGGDGCAKAAGTARVNRLVHSTPVGGKGTSAPKKAGRGGTRECPGLVKGDLGEYGRTLVPFWSRGQVRRYDHSGEGSSPACDKVFASAASFREGRTLTAGRV